VPKGAVNELREIEKLKFLKDDMYKGQKNSKN
jgi:hypothetical protein